MGKSNNKKNIKRYKKLLLLIILGLGIGFAIVFKEFNFSIDTLVKTQSWNVYFENVQVRDGSIEAPLPVISNDKTNVDYSAALELPGEYYEFTVVAVNGGTIDAMIDVINFPEIDSSLSDKVSYTVTYMDGVVPQSGDVLVAGHSVTYKVRVEYAENYSESLEVIPFASSFSVDYVLANNQGHNVHVNHELNSIEIINHRSIVNNPIYMNNMQVSEGSLDASVIDIENSKVNYKVVLEEPGDFYEFTVDAINTGGKDVLIKKIMMTELDAETLEYLQFDVTYENGDEIQLGDVLEANSQVTYKVLIKYLEEAAPNKHINFDLNIAITYALEPKEFLEFVEDDALSDENINFRQISSNSNGKGLYLMNSTKEDTYPIYYYRGDVSNNNALFAGYCWKVVRTTDTGGTKLIYNGERHNVYNNYEKIGSSSYVNVVNNSSNPFTYDETEKTWTSTRSSSMTFSFAEAGDYKINFKMELKYSCSPSQILAFYRDGKLLGAYTRAEQYINLYDVTPSTVITVKHINSCNFSSSFSVSKGTGNSSFMCGATGDDSQLPIENFVDVQSLDQNFESAQLPITTFNTTSDFTPSPAYNGYMYGNVYGVRGKTVETTYLYGNGFTYQNGLYTLINTRDGIDNTHHYTCFDTSGQCSELYYVYEIYYNMYYYYFTLTSGKDIGNIWNEMMVNTNNSTIKGIVDTWFNTKFRSYFTNRGKDYNNYLEDTVWCNDRSYDDRFSINPNGGYTSYNSYGTYYTSHNRMSQSLSLVCSNKNDAFTVRDTVNGNGKLDYPVGLLTSDEVRLAGGLYKNNNTSYYLNTGNNWWTMTPDYFDYIGTVGRYGAYNYKVDSSGSLQNNYASGTDVKAGVRPSISLKRNVKVVKGGDGTAVHPYEFVID